MTKELNLMIRTHFQVGQSFCALCGQPSLAAHTGTGLYDGGLHLGDMCKECLQGGRRRASARTRSHSSELRKLAEHTGTHSQNRDVEQTRPWLCRYADFLDNLASRVEGMTDWLPRPK